MGPEHTYNSSSSNAQSEQRQSAISSVATIDYASSSTTPSHNSINHESESDLDIEQPENPDNEISSTQSSKITTSLTEYEAPKTPVIADDSLTQDINLVVVDKDRDYEAIIEQRTQEYNETIKSIQEDGSVHTLALATTLQSNMRGQSLSTASSVATIDYASSSTASLNDTFDNESQSDLDIQQAEDLDADDIATSSTPSSKKRSDTEDSDINENWCDICNMPLPKTQSFKVHERLKFHGDMKQFLEQDIPAKVMHKGGTQYQAMSEEEAQEYEQKEHKEYPCDICKKPFKSII